MNEISPGQILIWSAIVFSKRFPLYFRRRGKQVSVQPGLTGGRYNLNIGRNGKGIFDVSAVEIAIVINGLGYRQLQEAP